MEMNTNLRSFGIGVISGMRSMTGPAVARWRARDDARFLLAAMAVGELLADKLPAVPPRTIPPALAIRAIAGGFAGGSVAESFNGGRRSGIFAGIAGAVMATYVMMSLRKAIVGATGWPDFVVALGEDALAVGGAIALTQP